MTEGNKKDGEKPLNSDRTEALNSNLLDTHLFFSGGESFVHGYSFVSRVEMDIH